MIQLSQTAAKEIRRLQFSRQQPNTYLRIRVQPGGCAGLTYTFELSDTSQEGDRLQESQGIAIAIDPISWLHLQEIKLDYSEDLMGGGFRFQNSQASSHCSCGQSFSPKG